MAYWQFDLTVTGYEPGTIGGSVRYITETGQAGQTSGVPVDSGSGNLLLSVFTSDQGVDLAGSEKIWFVLITDSINETNFEPVANSVKVIGPYIVSDIGTIV
ncbi:hypothetical protein [Marinobacter sp. W-8]|uniref:hypothetical protein n=1 Tax=Marinobacter sp. W-8 TaxID=3369658 RepID=UPI0037CA5789